MLSGVCAARRSARLRFPSPGLAKPEVRELAAEAGLPVAAKAESQDLCFLAGEGKRALPRAPRRPAATAGRDRRLPRARCWARTAATTSSPSASAAGIGRRRAREPLYVLETDAARTASSSGPRDELVTRRVRVRDATLHRPGGRVDRVKLRYRSRPIAVRRSPRAAPGSHDEL